MPTRKLNVFLCHAKEDKPTVRELYRQLTAEGWMDVWLDEENLFPGQEWDMEIEKAVEAADVVIVCLSAHSVSKEGYVQKELRFVLNIADEKPEGTIFVIPLRLDDCQVPRRIRGWQYADYFPNEEHPRAFQRLLFSMKMRARRLDIPTIDSEKEPTHLKLEQEALQEISLHEKTALQEQASLFDEKIQQQHGLSAEELIKNQYHNSANARVGETKGLAGEKDNNLNVPLPPSFSIRQSFESIYNRPGAPQKVAVSNDNRKKRNFFMALASIIVPLLVVTISVAIYQRNGASSQYDTYIELAQMMREQAMGETDPVRQREAWNNVLKRVAQAETYGVTSDTLAMRQEAQAKLDALLGVARLNFRPIFASGTNAQISRMAASETDLYMLDATQGNILRAAIDRGYALDGTFDCKPGTYGNNMVGSLLDLLVLP
ncbi:MAG: toll/interleukin-1 receptor domain-containing protein, partial [Chloroflexota bacterium]